MDKVVFQTLGCEGSKQIGIATLNVEHALNALDLDMVRLLSTQLNYWQQDDKVACVVLDAVGDKAFCAGGDVRELTEATMAMPGKIAPEVQTFFTEEYQLDYLIHNYEKPILVWGHGFVMGGGLGLMAGASHRVVTESSRIAMPEVPIGLFPDVGGSYFLNRMPGKLGLFLGLTGYNMNAADALYVHLADFGISQDDKEPLWDALARLRWQDKAPINHELLSQTLTTFSNNELSQSSHLEAQQGRIDTLVTGSLAEIYEKFSKLETEESWLSRAKRSFLAGSPLSWLLVENQMNLGIDISLADCLRKELDWAVNCCVMGDFCEGVRALLIDKDKNPQWKFKSLTEIPEDFKEKFLSSPWPETEQPLREL